MQSNEGVKTRSLEIKIALSFVLLIVGAGHVFANHMSLTS